MPGGVSLRPAREADAPRIRALVHEGQINPTGLDWTRFLLAEAPSGEVIGCVQCKPHQDGSRELASLVVSRAWQGQGVARLLVERLLAENSGELYLMCRASLGPFYEKFGFHPVETPALPRYFRRVKQVFRVAEVLLPAADTLLVMRRAPRGESSEKWGVQGQSP